jgi:TonB family protein
MMKALIQYQIEVAICMAALTLLYLLLWRKDTNFIFKRILLLGIPLSSIVIPMINLNIDLQPAQQAAPIQYISYLPAQLELVYMPIAAEAEKLTGWELAFWFLIAGALVMLIRLAGSYYRILQLYRRSSLAPGGNYRIIEEPVQSFSFFNMVMINRTQAQSSELEYILSHEEAHSRQGHSHDVLWLELIKVLHWFNPVIWLITRESKQNMEYLADQEVALKTGSLKSYQYAIVQHAARRGCQLLKTQFSKSNLKRRIAMMNQTNKHTIRSWKLLPAFPVLAVLFMSFSLKIEHLDFTKKVGKVLPFEKMDEPIAQLDTMPNEVFSIVEEMPAPVVGDMDSYYASIYSDLRYPAEARSLGIEGKVFVKFLVQKDGSLTDIEAVQGIGYGCDEEAVRLITEGSKWHPGKQRGQAVDVRMIIPIAFAKEKSKISGVVYTDDGAPVPGATVIIEGTSIGTVTDLDGKFLLTVDSDRTEIVVASVGFKPQTLAIIDGKDYKIYLESDSNAAPPTVVVDNTIDPKKRPLYIVDGIEMEDIGDNALNPQDMPPKLGLTH